MLVERDPYVVLQVGRSETWPEIRAAYRTLARRFHADGSTPDRDRMVELNAAYACLERAHQATIRQASVGVPVGPGLQVDGAAPAPLRPAAPGIGSLLDRVRTAGRVDTPVVDFGQYAGWRIAEIAECDPRYLRWLSRHSSGHRFRAAIELVLGANAEIGWRASVR